MRINAYARARVVCVEAAELAPHDIVTLGHVSFFNKYFRHGNYFIIIIMIIGIFIFKITILIILLFVVVAAFCLFPHHFHLFYK